jgi:hypothetical protein
LRRQRCLNADAVGGRFWTRGSPDGGFAGFSRNGRRNKKLEVDRVKPQPDGDDRADSEL